MRTASIPLTNNLTLRYLATEIDRETKSEGSLASMVLGFAKCAGADVDRPLDQHELDMTIAGFAYDLDCESPMNVEV